MISGGESCTSIKSKSKSKRKKCATPHCRGLTELRKSGPRKGKSKGALCAKCRCARWRANNPFRDAFIRLKSHAKNREIEFTITFDYFKRFAKRTQLITRRGIHGEAMTVDRKHNLRGYIPGNIKAMTRAENSRKRCRHDQIRMERGLAWQRMYHG